MNRFCFRRIRIRLPGESKSVRFLAKNLLPLVEGILRVEVQKEKILVVYDNRKIQAWQIVKLAGQGLLDQATLKVREEHFLERSRLYFTAPAVIFITLAIKRFAFGRSKLAESFLIFELATLVSVFSGYPLLRKQITKLAYKLQTTDDRLLAQFGMGVALLRESTTVFTVLFLLNYNAYRKHRQTIVAIARAGEQIAVYDQENKAPKEVRDYESTMTKFALFAAGVVAITTRDPLRVNAVLLALNPRLGSLSSKYALNQAEILAHTDCRYIPLTSGEKIYELAESTKMSRGALSADEWVTLELSKRLREKVKGNLRVAAMLHVGLLTVAVRKNTASSVNLLTDGAVILMLLYFNRLSDLKTPVHDQDPNKNNHSSRISVTQRFASDLNVAPTE